MEEAVGSHMRSDLGLGNEVDLAVVNVNYRTELRVQHAQLEQTVYSQSENQKDQGDKSGAGNEGNSAWEHHRTV